jgi:hypothetical protein
MKKANDMPIAIDKRVDRASLKGITAKWHHQTVETGSQAYTTEIFKEAGNAVVNK